MTVWGFSVAPQLTAQPAACTRAKLTASPASAPFRAPHSFLGFLTISVPALLSHHLLSPGSPCRPPAFLPSDFCPSAPRRSRGQLLWGWLCGLSWAPEQALSPAEKAALEQKLTSIEEEPLWRSVCNINAVLLLAVNIFLWGYFA